MQDKIAITFGDFDMANLECTPVAIGEKTILVKPSLGLAETVSFTDNIAVMLLDDETAIYRPELFEFAFDVMTLAYYTNAELPEDLEERFTLILHTDLCAKVREAIDTDQLRALRCAVKAKLDHLVRCAENTRSTKMQQAALEKAMAVYQVLSEEE